MASLISRIASSLAKVYEDIQEAHQKSGFCAKYLSLGGNVPKKLGKAIFETFDKTVNVAESAKKQWDDALHEGRLQTAKKVKAISKVGHEIDKSKEQITELERELQGKRASQPTHRDWIDESLRSTSMYATWCDGIKDDIANAHQHMNDSNVFRDLHEKCDNYASQIRERQDMFKLSKK